MAEGGFEFDFDPQLGDFLKQNGHLDPPKAQHPGPIAEQRKEFLKPFM